ncbi:MAG: hypothetical protein WBX15_11225 [Thermoanaerobaculia bacterium]
MIQSVITIPQFPIAIVFEDGDCQIYDSPDDLQNRLDCIDTTLADNRIWIRDNMGRAVLLRMIGGEIYHFEAAE